MDLSLKFYWSKIPLSESFVHNIRYDCDDSEQKFVFFF